MKDFDGVEIFEKVECKVDALLNNLASRYVIQIRSDKQYICYAMNGERFELTEKETDYAILKRATAENVLILKKYLAEKWMEV